MQLHVRGMITILSLLDSGFVFSSRSILNRRINHRLTNMDKLLHPFLKVNVDQIIEYDLSNSQPLILANILNNILSDTGSYVSKFLFDKFISEYILSPTHPNLSTPTLLYSHFEKVDCDY